MNELAVPDDEEKKYRKDGGLGKRDGGGWREGVEDEDCDHPLVFDARCGNHVHRLLTQPPLSSSRSSTSTHTTHPRPYHPGRLDDVQQVIDDHPDLDRCRSVISDCNNSVHHWTNSRQPLASLLYRFTELWCISL
ncbi:hypothetical protein EYR40_011137 [Pleurotus pulmonarius]|nr:hypothetical protein EYR36_002907 [Pleurotus pulmonarius]KAF4583669.1 hypothetical protein EYR38_002424 [Pleurotus pulmonarius]KAF4587116.1 hypothetical protein EYR40_011137 [Pleurotus pulmonarius]